MRVLDFIWHLHRYYFNELITEYKTFHTRIGDTDLIMKEVGEMDAEGKGLFMFDDAIKAYKGDILQMIANPTNKAGKFNLALKLFVFLILTFTLLKSNINRSIFPQTKFKFKQYRHISKPFDRENMYSFIC
jgi:hypothetical protein